MYIQSRNKVVYIMNMSGIYLVYHRLTCIYMVYTRYIHGISKAYGVLIRMYGIYPYIPIYTVYIWIRKPYAFDIHGIYHVYTMYIPCIYPAYTC